MVTWFILFSGESEDGRGIAKFAGRTTDYFVAEKHLKAVRKSLYTYGHVAVYAGDAQLICYDTDDLLKATLKGAQP